MIWRQAECTQAISEESVRQITTEEYKNHNLMSCKLQTTCSSQGFGMNTESKDHLHNSASAKRGELKFRGLIHVICKQHMLGVQLMVKNVLH